MQPIYDWQALKCGIAKVALSHHSDPPIGLLYGWRGQVDTLDSGCAAWLRDDYILYMYIFLPFSLL